MAEGNKPTVVRPHRKGVIEPSMSYGEFAEMWWSGELAKPTDFLFQDKDGNRPPGDKLAKAFRAAQRPLARRSA